MQTQADPTSAPVSDSVPTPRRLPLPEAGWRGALFWGITVALLHRLLLMLWLPLAWSVLGAGLNNGNPDFHTARAQIAPLTTPADQLLWGVWRRWDAVHYLDLASNGYRVDHPGPTVFGPLTPAAIALGKALFGSIDLAAAVFETIAFAAALIAIYRLCAVFYRNEALGKWAVLMTALLPLSFFFAAPMSEAPFLAFSVGTFVAAAGRRWGIAGVLGMLAALTRNQGVLLVLPLATLLWQALRAERIPPRKMPLAALRRAWPLALLPAAYVLFEVARRLAGLPPLSDVYRDISYIFFTSPIEGLLYNLRYIVADPARAAASLDLWAMGLVLLLAPLSLAFRAHRRLALQAFTWSMLLLFLSKMNWEYGTDTPIFTQSFGRYALMLFPLWIMLAAGLRRVHPVLRLFLSAGLVLALMLCSALFTLALAGP
jgi:hypothetical protein